MSRGTLLTLLILGGVGMGTLTLSARHHPETLPEGKVGPVPIPVEVTTAVRGEVTEDIEVVGTLTPKKVAAVHSEYPGVLSEVLVMDWEEVREGEILARLDRREIEARVGRCVADVEACHAEILKNEACLRHASREFERVTTLNSANVVPERSHDEAVRARDMALADLAGSKARLRMAEESLREARLQLEKSDIRAPINGIVSARNAQVGERVDGSGSGKPLFEIVDNKILDLILSVPSTCLAKVRVDQTIHFTTDVFPGKTFSAQIKFINPRADKTTRAVSILAEVQNESGELKDGLYVRGKIETSHRHNVLLVPQVSVLYEQDPVPHRYVFIVSNGKVHRQSVETGALLESNVEIVKGLEGHEQVVTRGAFLLHDGDVVMVASTENPLAKTEEH